MLGASMHQPRRPILGAAADANATLRLAITPETGLRTLQELQVAAPSLAYKVRRPPRSPLFRLVRLIIHQCVHPSCLFMILCLCESARC